MKIFGTGVAILAFGLGGCGTQAGNEAAGGGNAANPALPAANGFAAGNAAATAGPCPYPSRGWRAAVVTEGTPPQLRIALTGEVRNDSSGLSPSFGSDDYPPPVVFLDLDIPEALPPAPDGNSADPMMQPVRDTGWHEVTNYYNYRPGHSTAVIRCNGREVARVAIPPPRPAPRP